MVSVKVASLTLLLLFFIARCHFLDRKVAKLGFLLDLWLGTLVGYKSLSCLLIFTIRRLRTCIVLFEFEVVNAEIGRHIVDVVQDFTLLKEDLILLLFRQLVKIHTTER